MIKRHTKKYGTTNLKISVKEGDRGWYRVEKHKLWRLGSNLGPPTYNWHNFGLTTSPYLRNSSVNGENELLHRAIGKIQ